MLTPVRRSDTVSFCRANRQSGIWNIDALSTKLDINCEQVEDRSAFHFVVAVSPCRRTGENGPPPETSVPGSEI